MKKFLEFTFPDEIRGWLVEEIHIFFRIFPHGGFVVWVVFEEIVAFDDLGDDLIDLSQEDGLLVFKTFHEEFVGDNVPVGVVFVTILKFFI